MLKSLSRGLISVVFPSSCETCGVALPLSDEAGLCASCEGSVALIPAPHCPKCGRHSPLGGPDCSHCEKETFYFDRVIAACYYDNSVKKLLRAFKFRRRRALAACLLRFVRRALESRKDAARWDCVAAVPMQAPRRLERGFNQAELLAKDTAKIVQRPFTRDVLAFKGGARLQSSLSKAQRKENVKDLFRVSEYASVRGKNVLLVDDILTTGQTASECARALKEAGAVSVDVLVAARGL